MWQKRLSRSIALTGLLYSSAAAVPLTAVEILNSAPANLSTSLNVRGFSFTLTEQVSVTSLGWLDVGRDGLAADHQIGIWTSTGSLLLTGSVASGTVNPLDGDFRYTSTLTGVTSLAAGDYVIAGSSTVTEQSLRSLSSSQVSFAPQIIYGNSMTGGASFAFPTLATTPFDIGYFGPNFQFETAVPELNASASLLPFFTLALLGLSADRRRYFQRR